MPISDELWDRADEIFSAALDLPEPERRAFAAERCGEDSELRSLVERLLSPSEDTATLIPGGALLGAVGEELREQLAREEATEEGSRFGRYRIVRELGRGGMAVVYLAERQEEDFRQLVALKVLRRGVDSLEVVRRFQRERQILALARHPNIGRLLDGGLGPDDRPYLAMEYVEGAPIDRHCDAQRLSVRERLELFLEVARAVDYAHRNLVVHRDIKPSNILVTPDGYPKLLDFGIAKLLAEEIDDSTRTGIRAMTPAYASPEQIEGGVITTATDVYQLGLLLYLLLTGRWPYRADRRSDASLMLAIVRDPPTRPSSALTPSPAEESAPGKREPSSEEIAAARRTTPERLRRELAGDLDTIVLEALRKEPERRYPSVAQLVGDVERYLAGRTISARRDSFAYRARMFVRRHRVATATAAAALLVVVGLIAFYTVRLGRERDRARREAAKAEEVAGFLSGLFEFAAPDRSRGEEVTVRQLVDRGAERIERDLASQPDVQASMMVVLGDVYRELAHYEEAEELAEQAVALRRERPGESGLDLADALHALGRVHERTRNVVAARAALEEALAIRVAALGPEAPDVARVEDALGTVMVADGELEAARELHEHALSVLERELGPEDVQVGITLNHLAIVLQDQREYLESIPLFERAIAILEKQLGADQPLTVRAVFNSAASWRNAGELERADALYRDTGERIERFYGPEHPNLAVVLNNHGNLLRQLGRLDDAFAAQQRAMEIFSAALGEDHLQVAWAANNLGLIERERGDRKAAMEYFRRSLEITERAVGPDHLEMAVPLKNYAVELRAEGRREDAIPYLERSLAALEKAHGSEHSFLSDPLRRLGELHLELGRPQLAEPLLRRALAVGRTDPGHRSGEITPATVALARCLAALGRRAEGEELLAAELAATDEEGRESVQAALAELREAGGTG